MTIKKSLFIAAFMLLATTMANAAKKTIYKPWSNGKLKVSANQRYLIHENGTPFFWLGNTAWLLPERLNRDEAEYFLAKERELGYNVEQIQVLNAIPTFTFMVSRPTTRSSTSARCQSRVSTDTGNTWTTS